MMNRELLLATTNRGKVRELERLLARLPVRTRRLDDFPDVTEPVEDGRTYADNAWLKARHYSAATGLLTLSDDSGLEVAALGGAPGVHSARFGGLEATYAERMALLVERLDEVGGKSRAARFVCVIALADPVSGESHLFAGRCEGRLAEAPRGAGGFGYDPLFIPAGHERTLGELPPEIKAEISHRAHALRQAVEFLHTRFGRSA